MERPPDLPEPVGPTCPYCNQFLQERPKQTTECPFCGNHIYVRTEQRIFASTLLTLEDARLADYFERTEDVGIEDAAFMRTREQIAERFVEDPRSRAALWKVLSKLVSTFVAGGDLQSLSMAYYLMARLLHAQGEDFFDQLQAAARTRLLHCKQSNLLTKVEITTADDPCERCQRLQRRVLTVDEALEQMPIPCKQCTHDARDRLAGFCRCSYLAKLR